MAWGALLSALCATALALLDAPLWLAALGGLTAALAAGAWKEWRDGHTPGAHVELLDAAATLLGGVLAVLPLAGLALAHLLWHHGG